jgi:methionyl-tRNA synthetase
MKKKILITSALPYANGPLHFGHLIGAYLPADCYARFQRLRRADVLYICGSDEHGVAITLSAQLEKRTPKEHVDHYHQILQDFFRQVNISFDHYSRTTWPGHVETTQEFFRDLLANGHIEARVTPQLYSESEKMFLADRYVVGTCPKCGFANARGDECGSCGASYEATDLLNPRSKMTGSSLILKPTKHWFLLFDHFKEQLASWLGEKQWKSNVLNFARHYIDDLKPRAITRDSDWGVPVPLKEAEGKVFYVWFDAPIGYISATREWAKVQGAADRWKDYWFDPKTQYVEFIGKDNIPFHAIFFPAMIMGQNQPYKIVDDLPANEFLNLEGRQFSKSEGWYIDLNRFFQRFTSDQIRYALAANAPENQDSEFTWKDFQMRCNSELVGKYGNLVNRVLVFIASHCSSKTPQAGEIDAAFIAKVDRAVDAIAECFETHQLRKACQQIMELAHLGNTYFNDKQPWIVAKDATRKAELDAILSACLLCIKALAFTSYPIIPETAEKIWRLLGYKEPLANKEWETLKKERIESGRSLPPPEVLFQKVEDALIEEEIAMLDKLKQKPEKSTPLKESITIDDVKKLDLRVGQILEAESVPKSKKLLKLLIDIGFEKRTVISGIAESHPDPAALIGKKVILIANLQPAKLMGIESQGMILAADAGDKLLELPALLQATPGSIVS